MTATLRGWLRAAAGGRPCRCEADVLVFGHVLCELAPPRRTEEIRGGYSEPVR